MRRKTLGRTIDFSTSIAYVINLPSRGDRLVTALPQLDKLGLDYKIEPAIDARELLGNNPFLSRAAEACFTSHFNALRQIADGSTEYGFILEDDFLVTSFKNLQRQIRKIEFENYDLIQIGWLQNTLRDQILIFVTTMEGKFSHALYRISKHIPFVERHVGNRLRVIRNSVIYHPALVQDDFKSGGHFYLVSKNFAKQLIAINPQPQVPIDGFFATLAATRKFRIARTTKSYVRQSNSPSSIKHAE